MKVEMTEAQWLSEHSEVSVEELAELSGLSPPLVHELVESGALTPIDFESAPWSFTADCVVAVRAVRRLQEDFELDPNAMSVALRLIERIRGLEAQLEDLRSQLPTLRLRR